MAKKAKLTKVGKPGDGKVVVSALPIPEERAAWLRRRGYEVIDSFGTELIVGDSPVTIVEPFLYLSPRATWWADDMWDMLEAVVKLREKEADNG